MPIGFLEMLRGCTLHLFDVRYQEKLADGHASMQAREHGSLRMAFLGIAVNLSFLDPRSRAVFTRCYLLAGYSRLAMVAHIRSCAACECVGPPATL